MVNGALHYTKEHVWVRRLEENQAQIGITPFAKQQLGKIICAEWPMEGEDVKTNQPIGTLESAKTVVDLYAPVDGKVIKVNFALNDDISLINEFPLDKGWIAVLQVENIQLLQSLLTEDEYQKWISEGE